MLLYVDDMILTGNNDPFIQQLILKLEHTFQLKNLEAIHHFLGIQIQHTNSSLFLPQSTILLKFFNV